MDPRNSYKLNSTTDKLFLLDPAMVYAERNLAGKQLFKRGTWVKCTLPYGFLTASAKKINF